MTDDTDLSDAIALIEREFPGWYWRACQCYLTRDFLIAPDPNSPTYQAIWRERGWCGPDQIQAQTFWDGVGIDLAEPVDRPWMDIALDAIAQVHAEIAEWRACQ